MVKEEIEGFKLFLSVTEKERLKFHNAPVKKPELFEKFLPYAMVLKVEKEWAKQFEGIYTKPPSWYQGNWNTFSVGYLASSLNSFSSSASSTIATSPASSSGFSGGSSGGGFGGGGGGSATGACYPSLQTVYLSSVPATQVTWSASIVGVTNPLYTWSGTGGLTGNGTSATITYNTAGTKTASVKVSGVNSSGQTTSQTIQCTPNVTVNQFGPLSGICTVAPTAAPVYQLSNTPPSAANDVTFTLTPSGGSGVYRAFTWDGVDPSVKVPGGGFPNPIQTITYFPKTTASTTFTRIYDKTGSKNVGVTIIDANPTVVPVTVQCDQVFIF
jgi:hypothetical protein